MFDLFVGDPAVVAALRRSLPALPESRRIRVAQRILDHAAEEYPATVRKRLQSPDRGVVRTEILNVFGRFEDLEHDRLVEIALQHRLPDVPRRERWAALRPVIASADPETAARLRSRCLVTRRQELLRVIAEEEVSASSERFDARLEALRALEAEMASHSAVLTRMAHRFVGATDDAAEVVQRSRVRVLQRIELDPVVMRRKVDEAFLPYLMAVVRNVALDLLRARQREQPTLDGEDGQEPVDDRVAIDDPGVRADLLRQAANGAGRHTALHDLEEAAAGLDRLIALVDAQLEAWVRDGSLSAQRRAGVQDAVRGHVVHDMGVPWTTGDRHPIHALLTDELLLARLGLTRLAVTSTATTLRQNALARRRDDVERVLEAVRPRFLAEEDAA